MPQQGRKDDETDQFFQDPDVADKLSNCKALSDVVPSEYRAVFYVGGKVPSLRPGESGCRSTMLTLYRTWAGRRSGERSYKRRVGFDGEITFANPVHLGRFWNADG